MTPPPPRPPWIAYACLAASMMLVGNSAVSAKLRQMVPALEAHLRHCGWAGPPVRIKLLNPG